MAYRKFSDILKAEREALRGDPTLAGLATLAGVQAGSRARTEQQQRYLFDIYSVFRNSKHRLRDDGGYTKPHVRASEPAKVAKPAKVDTLQAWVDGCRSLPATSPASNISPERWQRILEAAELFLTGWAGTAHTHGWTDLDVFGCHPTRPAARFDCMGLILLLDRCRITSLDKDGADLLTDTGAKQRFRRRPMPPGTIRLWELCVEV